MLTKEEAFMALVTGKQEAAKFAIWAREGAEAICEGRGSYMPKHSNQKIQTAINDFTEFWGFSDYGSVGLEERILCLLLLAEIVLTDPDIIFEDATVA